MFRMVSDRVPRREFLRSAVAIGGSAALSACVDVELGSEGTAEAGDDAPEVPTGVDDPAELPRRQHAWNEYMVRDRRGNTAMPRHQLILALEYAGDGTPTEEDRETVEAALRSLERAYQWGTGGNTASRLTQGLLFTVGYTPSYFDRFEGSLPESVDLPAPESVLADLGEEDARADDFDAALVMNSDYAHVVLAAEEAMRGTLDELNGVAVDAALTEAFEVVDRRSGFVGKGLPHDNLDSDAVPEDAPMSMGFKSGLVGNQSPEDGVTLQEGPFAGGTTQMLSRLVVDVEDWYEHDAEERVRLMFSPEHDLEDVGEFGGFMTDDSGTTEEIADSVHDHAQEHGKVGHAQKTAAARDDEFVPRILRRSEGVSDDLPEPSMNFSSIQRGIEDFLETRRAMNREFDGVDHEHNGILNYIETRSRATLLVPPRDLRALPTPNP